MRRIPLVSLCTLAMLLTSCGAPDATVKTKAPYKVDTVFAYALTNNAYAEKTTTLKAGTQVSMTAQGSGRIANILVKSGQFVQAGQTLIQLQEPTGNSVAEAQIALENAQINLSTTRALLDQGLAQSRISYEKALQDYKNAELSGAEQIAIAQRNAQGLQTDARIQQAKDNIRKAELDLGNAITAQNEQLKSLDTSYTNQLQNLTSFLANVIQTTDKLVGVSDMNKTENDSFEYLLGALDSRTKTTAERAIGELLKYKNWSPDATLPLLTRVESMQDVYTKINATLTATEELLIASVNDANFTTGVLAGHRATIDGYQAQYSSITAGLVGYLNGAKTFLATYENDRTSKELALTLAKKELEIQINNLANAESNSQSGLIQTELATDNGLRAAKAGLDIAQTAYETTQSNYRLSLSQLQNNVDSASLRLSSAYNRFTVTAPVSGVIGKIYVDAFEDVSMGRPLIDIAGKYAESEITLDASMVEQIKVGDTVRGTYRNTPIEGKILSISPIADAGLNFSIKIGFDETIDIYGDFVTLSIPTTGEFPSIPLSAVTILSPNNGIIWTLTTTHEGELFARDIPVSLGRLSGDSIEIISQIPAGTEIILSDMKNYNATDFVLEKNTSTPSQTL